MKKYTKDRLHKFIFLLIIVCAFFSFSGCGKMQTVEMEQAEGSVGQTEEEAGAEGESQEMPGGGTGAIGSESAADAEVDFEALTMENPDIFAWLYVPGTEIDCPVLQSGAADDFYETHDAFGKENPKGAVYIEMANRMDMTDFNTVIHGRAGGDGSFEDLYGYADSDFFDANEKIYLYLDGNLLVYEIFAAYEREDDSLIRKYNFASAKGCMDFLTELYTREMGKQIREGWEGLNSNHFLITLTTKKDEASDRQFVVAAALIEDAAGTINREILK